MSFVCIVMLTNVILKARHKVKYLLQYNKRKKVMK